jgi:hypothetical protein
MMTCTMANGKVGHRRLIVKENQSPKPWGIDMRIGFPTSRCRRRERSLSVNEMLSCPLLIWSVREMGAKWR